MNKKVLTLCAGVLLVGGSAVFTVNAVNAGNENVPVVAYAAELRATTGYTLDVVTSGKADVWTLTKEGYLSPVPGWYVGANKEIVKGTEKAVKFTINEKTMAIMEGTKAWTFDGKTSLYLWNAEKKQVTEAGENLTLATAKQDILDLSSDNQVAQASFTKVTATTVEQKADEYSVEDLQKFAIKKVGKEFYLTVDFEGTTYYVSAPTDNKEIVFSAEPNEETGKVSNDSKMGAIKVGGNYLALNKTKIVAASKNEDGTQLLRAFDEKNAWYVSEQVKADNIYLAYFENTKGDAPKAARTVVASVSRVFEFGETKTAAYDAESVNEYNTWTIEAVEGKNYLKIGDKYLTLSTTSVTLGTKATSEVAVNAKGQLTLGGQPLYIGENGFTVLTSNTQPAAIYAVTENGVTTQPSSKVEAGDYVIAQALTGAVMDVKYATDAVTVDDSHAPGSEYGTNDDVTIDNDEVLHFSADVTTLNIPVYITYKSGNDVYYYVATSNGATWTKDGSKTAWVLKDGNLVNLDSYRDGDAVVVDGVVFAPTTYVGGHEATVILSRESLIAPEAPDGAQCDIPRLDEVNSDYVLLGGMCADGVMRYITEDPNNPGKAISVESYADADLWVVTKKEQNEGRFSYIFTNRRTGTDLKINGYTRFMAYDYRGGVQLLGVDEGNNIEQSVVLQAGQPTTTSGRATVLGLYQSTLEQYTAHWLLHRYGSSFQLNITNDYKDHADKTWHGNEFDNADLVPVVYYADEFIEITPNENDPYAGEKRFLLKKRGTNLYIVLNVDKKWTNVVSDLDDTSGYRFELLSEENVRKVLKGETIEGDHYMTYFRINYLEGQTEYKKINDGHDIINNDLIDPKVMNPYCIEVSADGYNWAYDVIVLKTDDTADGGHLNLYVTVNDNCKHDDRRPSVSFYDIDENIVRGEDKENNPLNYRYVNIAFKAGNDMQFKNGNANVNLDGKVLGISEDGQEAVPTDAEYFLFDKAEGQWAVSMTMAKDGTSKDDIDTRMFTFTNRENKAAKIEVTSMHYMGNNMYAVEYNGSTYKPFGYINGKTRAQRDTLVITPAEGNLKLTAKEDAFNMDSYANWTKEDLQDKTFQLSVDAAAQLYVTENEGKDSHFLGLTDDALEVTNWRLVPFTATRVHDVDAAKYLTAGTDSVYTMSQPQYYDGGKFYVYNDTTATVAYALQNIQNNEWLRYDPSQSQTILSMICDPNSKNYTTANLNEAYRFVLKEKAKGSQEIESGKYNIIGVNSWEENVGADGYITDEADAYYTLDLSKKLYGATSYQKLGAVEVQGAYEDPTSNSIFTIATTASQEYVKATPRDTVRIYGAEENDFLLYENGQFLNLGNTGDIAPAMVLDSAYVNRPGNNRYQYLLVVNPTYVEAEFDNHPNSPSVPHMIKPDTMYGRFLVNQIDSAVFVSRNHNNKFINDVEADEKEVKLGFQWGYHTGDKLFLTDGENGPVIETLNLGTADFNKAKFAFKYVNEAAGDDFKVQTAWYDYDSAVKAGLDNKAAWAWNNEGYLKSVNGVIVVTNGYTHGEEFLMAQDETNPTANETIAAESAISVVATDGAVVIKGAEGKNVVIATILGKVVANETINSDNETIAVPAGIAVVSVDGESFKVVVK